MIDRRLHAGAEVFGLEIRGQAQPLARFVGMLKEDPLLQPWKDAIAEYRRKSGEWPCLPLLPKGE